MSNNSQKSKELTQLRPAYISSKLKILVALLSIIIAVSYLAISSFGTATTKYMSVQDAINKSENENKGSLGVIGKLVPDTFHRSADGLTAFFSITDDESSGIMPVSYSGEIGEIFFNENAEIIIQGTIKEDGIFETTSLSIRCPSKYVDRIEESNDI
ncbi:MAG: hypothetical protein CL762_00995 [Chloroflexi bacterium]|nr:hypothetical protein [Chloroflexota bacterium]|tara:strand:+ start:13998 stop:14468 length:471 start_codon:yes stop_codon:yes gene_type:complete